MITVCNEAQVLTDCLHSVKWADEIVIVDMYSDDGSAAIYSQFTDRIFLHIRESVAERTYNFGLSHCTGDWVLKIDPE